MVVITDGRQGAYLKEGKEYWRMPIYPDPKPPLERTGAGDAFRAGFLYGLGSGWGIEDALRLGNAMGSFVVEIEGTLLDVLDMEEVWLRAKEAYGEPLPN